MLGERDMILHAPPPLLGGAPLSAEQSNEFPPITAQVKQQTDLLKGFLDPMMADLWDLTRSISSLLSSTF